MRKSWRTGRRNSRRWTRTRKPSCNRGEIIEPAEDPYRRALVDSKAIKYAERLDSGNYDLVGRDVDFPNAGETIDVLMVEFGGEPQVSIRNYYLESIPQETVMDDSRYRDRKKLLPDSSWDLDARQVRKSRDSVKLGTERQEWDFCYSELDMEQMEAFSSSFLGSDVENLLERNWIESEKYFKDF